MSVATIPRLRMFAGPNGSGKSTIKLLVDKKLLGKYINPDELEAQIRRANFLDFGGFNIETDESETLDFLRKSVLLKNAGLATEIEKLEFDRNRLVFTNVEINAYFASVAADFIRRKLLLSRQTFTFETVMSAPDKVAFLAEAQSSGYRTYLYYVATEDPEINISRVEYRVKTGGHDVPVDKITARYQRSLALLWEAIKYTNRAYIFDNSAEKAEWIAEITDAASIEIKTETVPVWFKKFVLDKIEN